MQSEQRQQRPNLIPEEALELEGVDRVPWARLLS